jgi:hypothetical protein
MAIHKLLSVYRTDRSLPISLLLGNRVNRNRNFPFEYSSRNPRFE